MIKIMSFLSKRVFLFRPFYFFLVQKKWRKENAHNYSRLGPNCHVFPCNDIKKLFSVINVGKGTYGPINAYYYQNKNSELLIGNYVSIGHNVLFLMGGNHYNTSLFNYPFKYFLLGCKDDSYSKGAIVVEDDVWIGMRVIILSGVKIGKGSIIGTGSVVTKDVEPFTIVAGNPAKIIKKRFEDKDIEKLMNLDYLNINTEHIISKMDLIYSKDEMVNDKIKAINN